VGDGDPERDLQSDTPHANEEKKCFITIKDEQAKNDIEEASP